MQVLFQVPEVKILRGRWNFVLQKCKGKRVLHLGCVDEGLLEERFAEGKLMHQELSRITKEVWGVDISESGITFLKSKGITNLFVGNVEKINELTELYSKKFDVIVASEIIEHLDNPGLFLESVKDFFGKNTEMIVTVPNAYRLSSIREMLRGKEYVHPDHNYWFSYKTITGLLKKHGYEIKELYTYSYNFTDYRLCCNLLPGPIGRLLCRTMKEREEGKGGNKSDLNKYRIKIGLKERIISYFERIFSIWLCHRNPFFADGIVLVVKLPRT